VDDEGVGGITEAPVLGQPKAPSPKHQIPNKRKFQNSKFKTGIESPFGLLLSSFDFEVVWDLVLGIWRLQKVRPL
jgi:hypothetical protein